MPDASQQPVPESGTDQVGDLVAALLTASRALVGISARSLAGIEETVTITQFRTLVVLASHGPSSLNRLAGRLGVNSSTAMRTVDRLVAADLVVRSTNETNRREVVLELSGRGQHLVDDVTSRRWESIERIVRAMPEARRSEMVNALVAFAQAADEPLVIDDAAALAW
ncbi:MarR family winged helix-turn-helix transcriptional regulator [Nocardioides marmorisolisilvae]|uniref:MarR family transcriptional regulator n=1 Tax=Nocardioides marmorisolisilvae TaxID=1542737 RepID=A0A3N0DXA2_9ACTN|nr:MarR family winged helix-turn-helix transcriptional regulator [Nocardioides marmorisolisilvae]RNL80217.1 MarR family transcriptional regulator [Nocardioides marmorisolisilvae]